MFKFFRKHQKKIFFVVAFIIIITFVFFGTYDSISSKKKKKEVAKTYTKEPIFKEDFYILSSLICMEGDILKKNSFFYKELFKGKVIRDIILKKDLSKIFQKKFLKIQKWDLYKHPLASKISLEDCLRKDYPHFLKVLEDCKKSEDFKNSLKFFFKLYAKSQKISFERLKQKLFALQKQMEVPFDYNMVSMQMAPFSSCMQWFGEEVFTEIATFLFQAGSFAKEKGYSASDEEVIFDLRKFYRGKLSKEIINCWKKAYLFKKLLKEESDCLVDDLFFEEYCSFKDKKAFLNLYHITLPSKEEFWRFLAYMDNVYEEGREKCRDKIAKSLFEQRFDVEIKKVNVTDLGVQIGERELWNFQISDKGWSFLTEEFSHIFKNEKKEDRFSVLENLNPSHRYVVDRFSREKMVLLENRVKDALEDREYKKEEIAILEEGSFLEGVLNRNLLPLLQKDFIESYSENGKDFYQIKVLKRKGAFLIPFAKAFQEEILEDILEDILVKNYVLINEEEKEFWIDEVKKPLKEVREELFYKAFSKYLKNCTKEDIVKEFFVSHLEKKEPISPFLKNYIKIKKTNFSRFSKHWAAKEIFSSDNVSKFSKLHVKGDKISFFEFLGFEVDKESIAKEMRKMKKVICLEKKRELIEKIEAL